MTKRTSSISRPTSIQGEWLPESADELPRRNGGDSSERPETTDASALLTDLQRAALRWLAFFD